jgi:hypothetical protein
MGRKASDEFTVPPCRTHHRELHRGGDEAACWHDMGIDAVIARWNAYATTFPDVSRSNVYSHSVRVIASARSQLTVSCVAALGELDCEIAGNNDPLRGGFRVQS